MSETVSPETLQALRRVARFHEDQSQKWASAAELSTPTPKLSGLVRRGWARSCQQEEGCRHERRIRYALYQITNEGRHALARLTP